MTDSDPYRALAILAEGAGFERAAIDYDGANFYKGGVKVRMIRQGDPGALRLKASYANGDRIADLGVQLGDVPVPLTIDMVRAFVQAMGRLSSATHIDG